MKTRRTEVREESLDMVQFLPLRKRAADELRRKSNMYLCMYACMHACMHACMYVCYENKAHSGEKVSRHSSVPDAV